MNYILLTNPHNKKDLLINLNLVVAIEEGTNSTKVWTSRRVYEVTESLQEICVIINEIQQKTETIFAS